MKLRTTHYKASLIGLFLFIVCLWFCIVAILANGSRLDSFGRIFPVHYVRQAVWYGSNSIVVTEDFANSAIYSRRCLDSLQQGDYNTAVTNCTQVIKDNPDNIGARINLGLANYHLGDYQKAIVQYQYAIAQKPEDYRALYNWGLSEVAMGNYQQGIKRYHAALNSAEAIADKDKALIFNDLGAAQILLRQYETAIANLDRAVKLDANSKISYFNRGCAYHHQGNYQQGIDDFTQVIKFDSNYTEAYISRAILYHLTRQERAAYQDLDIALQQYQTQGDRESYQKIIGLKNSITASKVQQTA